MPLVAASLSDCEGAAADATTSTPGASTAAIRPMTRAREFAFMLRSVCAPVQKLRWKRSPMLTSWKLMNSKLSRR